THSISNHLFFTALHPAHRDLHSFPTRRSSDLVARAKYEQAALQGSDRPRPRRRARKLGRRRMIAYADTCVVIYRVEGAPSLMSADRKSTRLNSSHDQISYAVFCLKKKKNDDTV